MNLIEHVADAIANDDDDTYKQSARIIASYKSADKAQKTVLDDVFISLCGWSLGTLIKESK